MSRMQKDFEPTWQKLQSNVTFRQGCIEKTVASKIPWHSPDSPRSSQVFCISVFGSLFKLKDGEQIFDTLLDNHKLLEVPSQWERSFKFEHIDRELLNEKGWGQPSSIDLFLKSNELVVCVESKFISDALDGFGRCSQPRKNNKTKQPNCLGYYGSGSDLKTGREAPCRLQISEGPEGKKRSARKYWELSEKYFQESVRQEQKQGDICPFFNAGNFQLMRNFLMAAESAASQHQFAVVAMVPENNSKKVREQVRIFQDNILLLEYRDRIKVITYDELANLLSHSIYKDSQELGKFIQQRIDTV